MALGTNLKILRSKTKYSQQDIADLLEINRTTYAHWESETNDIKAHFIPKLAKIFDVPITDLFQNCTDFQDTIYKNDKASCHIIINLSDSEIAIQLTEQIKQWVQNLRCFSK
ncbi:MAG: helix-turn-helix transcriptional regulator [Weeksellaceae bacterium]|jgi:transcriptional regulator with XRE-family HTH domain|nr:helix-turn-helix transcriptional regulator [Weeksellaceae bacterium]